MQKWCGARWWWRQSPFAKGVATIVAGGLVDFKHLVFFK